MDLANLTDSVYVSCGSLTQFVNVCVGEDGSTYYASVVKKKFNESFSIVVDSLRNLPIASSLPVLTSAKLRKLTVFKANEVSNPRIENVLAYTSYRFYH